jgi:hypothetical protein
VPGVDWLDFYYGNRTDTSNGGVTVHPYQYDEYAIHYLPALNPDTFVRDVDTIRVLMRNHGDEGKALWVTELGWAPNDSEATRWRSALSLPEAYVLGLAGSPASFYDRMFWEVLRSTGGSALIDTFNEPNPCYYTYKQMASELPGKRLNGRILAGDTSKDNHTFLYEMENPADGRRTWIGWRTWRSDSPAGIQVEVPLRAQLLDTILLARAERTESATVFSAGTDGWFHVTLDSIPVYIREDTSAVRPDLTIDSVWTDPASPDPMDSVRFWARIRNVGNDTSHVVHGTSSPTPPLVFYAEDSAVGAADSLPKIPPNAARTVRSSGKWVPNRVGDVLVKAAVNPGRIFMELVWDNNARYRLYKIPY